MNEELLGKGYNIYVDNWYTSKDLFLQLHNKQTNDVGTVRANRAAMAKELLEKTSNRPSLLKEKFPYDVTKGYLRWYGMIKNI
jgi:hypothetical protein